MESFGRTNNLLCSIWLNFCPFYYQMNVLRGKVLSKMPHNRPLNWYEPIQVERTFKVDSVHRLCLKKVNQQRRTYWLFIKFWRFWVSKVIKVAYFFKLDLSKTNNWKHTFNYEANFVCTSVIVCLNIIRCAHRWDPWYCKM